MEKIAVKDLKQLGGRLADQNITLDVTPAAQEWLANKGYEPAYGARPLQRLITTAVETPLAKQLIAGDIVPESTVTIGVKDGALDFTSKENTPAPAEA